MFLIDQAHCLATQEIILHARKQPLAPRKRNEKDSLAPIELNDSRPATANSQSSFLSAEERLGLHEGPHLGLGLDEGGNESWSGSEEPIIETPMRIVRPWPRRGGKGEEGRGTVGSKDGMAGSGALPGGDELTTNGDKKSSIDLEGSLVRDGQPPKSEDGTESLDDDFSEAPIAETPMGIVRPRTLRRRPKRDSTGGPGGTKIPPAELPAKYKDRGLKSEEKRTTGPPTNDTKAKRKGSWTERNGDITNDLTTQPLENGERESDPAKELPTKTDAGASLLGDKLVSTVFKDIVDKFLANNRKTQQTETDPLGRDSPFSKRKDRATTNNTTEPNDLHNITILTLLTEDLRGLTTFYVTVLGATLASSTPASTTLAFTPQLSIRLLNSSFARNRAVFGEDVTVGRQAAMPKRMMLGVEVRDVDAVWRRLMGFGHGQEEDDGQEILCEVRTAGGRRSVCFVDLAGHCWEAWEQNGDEY